MRISDWSSDVCSSDLGGAVVLSSAFPVRKAHAAGTPPEINVGQIAPMTGSAAEFGPYYRDAVQLAINQINKAAKEVFGGPIINKHITVDTTTLPTVGVQAARQMVDTDNVAAIRSEAHTPELQALMRTSYAVFCLKN